MRLGRHAGLETPTATQRQEHSTVTSSSDANSISFELLLHPPLTSATLIELYHPLPLTILLHHHSFITMAPLLSLSHHITALNHHYLRHHTHHKPHQNHHNRPSQLSCIDRKKAQKTTTSTAARMYVS